MRLEPLVNECGVDLDIGAGLTILAEDIDGVLILLFLKEKLAHIERATVISDLKVLRLLEGLHSLLSNVEDLAGQSGSD